MVKQNVQGRRGKKKSFGKDEFPPLPSNRERFLPFSNKIGEGIVWISV